MATTEQKLICVTCPKGCTLTVTQEGETILKVDAGCKRGQEYARQELTDPRRMVATTVKIKGGIHALMPVYTSKPFPKPRIHELLTVIRKTEIQAPVNLQQVLIKDVLGTGVDILASRQMEAVK